MCDNVEWVQQDIQINERNEFFVPEDYEASYLEKDEENA